MNPIVFNLLFYLFKRSESLKKQLITQKNPNTWKAQDSACRAFSIQFKTGVSFSILIWFDQCLFLLSKFLESKSDQCYSLLVWVESEVLQGQQWNGQIHLIVLLSQPKDPAQAMESRLWIHILSIRAGS